MGVVSVLTQLTLALKAQQIWIVWQRFEGSYMLVQKRLRGSLCGGGPLGRTSVR